MPQITQLPNSLNAERLSALLAGEAEHVGDAVGDEESIGGHAGPEEPGQDHVPDKAHDPAGEGGQADQSGRLGDLSAFLGQMGFILQGRRMGRPYGYGQIP